MPRSLSRHPLYLIAASLGLALCDATMILPTARTPAPMHGKRSRKQRGKFKANRRW